ncbi:NAD(+) diphosphatase [Sphingomonas alba]|uniref:NAD(+) diphosphatase n=1 Tax=Sphingomonas alba TaxID=2908208 RepID=A0ABT0RLM2_9SPHN|nr:NAD(+) diphosphatase [Sphingomonas alba]MCL6683495.1 NAD(+) diphosphatase [Sphingomonas alba]
MPPDVFFGGLGLDRADVLRAQPERIAELATRPDARQLQWAEGLPLLDSEGRLNWGDLQDPQVFLGLDGDSPRFSSLPRVDAGRSAFGLLADLNDKDAPLFACALSLANWHSRHPHCSVCGHASDIVRGGWSRRCPDCGAEHFPRSDPVVIMLAEHDGRLLLGRQPHYPPDRYSALAGFVEPGENIEAAVAREISEEAGIAVTDVRYIASQPWPFPSTLMIGCQAHALSDELTIDFTELEDARWFTRDEVAAALARVENPPFLPPPRHAIARTLLEHWLAA